MIMASAANDLFVDRYVDLHGVLPKPDTELGGSNDW